MITTQYCVFWVPSTSHQAPAILSEFKEPDKLSTKQLGELYAEFVNPEGLTEEELSKKLEYSPEDRDAPPKIALYFFDNNYQPIYRSSFTDSSESSIPSRCCLEIDPTDEWAGAEKQRLRATITVNNKTQKDIELAYADLEAQKEGKVTLKFIDACRNGMLYYKYSYDNTNPYQEAIHLAICSAVYHLVKRFFHQHEYHNGEKDSMVKAYVSSQAISIRTCNNKPLLHYLEELEDIVSCRREELQDMFSHVNIISNKIKDIREIRSDEAKNELYVSIRNQQNDRQYIEELCYKMLGFGIYFKTLLKSWYNSNHNSYWVHKQQLFLASYWHGCRPNITYINKNTIEQQLSQAANAKKILNRISINGMHAIAGIENIRQKNLYGISNDSFFLKYNSIIIQAKEDEQRQQKEYQEKKEKERERRFNKHLTIYGIIIGVVASILTTALSKPLGALLDCSKPPITIEELKHEIQKRDSLLFLKLDSAIQQQTISFSKAQVLSSQPAASKNTH
jgi:hypothetical protein